MWVQILVFVFIYCRSNAGVGWRGRRMPKQLPRSTRVPPVLSFLNICFPKASWSSRSWVPPLGGGAGGLDASPDEILRRRASKQTDDTSGVMRFACCLTSQGDTKNIIRRKQLLFSLFPALTSRHVAASRGICHRTKPARRRIRLPSAGADVRTVGGVEVRRAQTITPLTAQIYF